MVWASNIDGRQQAKRIVKTVRVRPRAAVPATSVHSERQMRACGSLNRIR